MQTSSRIQLTEFVQHFGLEFLHRPDSFEKKCIKLADVNRPGLQLFGFYDYFVADRLQVLGMAETTYLGTLEPAGRQMIFEKLFSAGVPAMVLCHEVPVYTECLETAKRHNVPVLRTARHTSDFVAACIAWLKIRLAPCITRHGVLVEVYGEGLLLLGESGVGKSETAIELVKRGHRLIADDAVEIRRTSDTALVGTAPESIRHYIELRGIGVINVARLFGVSAVKPTEKIDLIIHLEDWKDGVVYDRLGLDKHYTELLGIEVPSLTVPVKPGRNLAVIIEVAAMNSRQKKMGYDSAMEFTKQINKFFEANAAAQEAAYD